MIGINENGQSVEDHSEYNILREAMANQMAHADHFSPQRSCIRVFDDRIEFSNPGGMPKPLDEMEQTFESLPRNPVIAKMFRLAHLSENLCYGLSKLKTWESVTGNPIRIETSHSSVKVTFYFRPTEENQGATKKDGEVGVNDTVNDTVKLSKRQQEVLTLIESNQDITHFEIAQALSITVITAKRTTKALRELGVLKRIGSDKTGYWEIKECGSR